MQGFQSLKDKILGTEEEEVLEPIKKMESDQVIEDIPEERDVETQNKPRSGEAFVVTHPEKSAAEYRPPE